MVGSVNQSSYPARSAMTSSRRRFLRGSAAVGAGVVSAGAVGGPGFGGTAFAAAASALTVLVNNVGYEAAGAKRAVIAGAGTAKRDLPFQLVDTAGAKVVLRGTARYAGPVSDWRTNHFPEIATTYWIADFSGYATAGQYTLAVEGAASFPFRIETALYERRTLGHVAHFFKDSRSSGQFDKADRSLPVKGSTTRVDAHGGW